MPKAKLLPRAVKRFSRPNHLKSAFVLSVPHYQNVAWLDETSPDLDQASAADVADRHRFQE